MDDHDTLEQLAPGPVTEAAAGAPGTASDALRLWEELRDYRHRRDAWECDLYRLVQSHRDLEARHWQLVLHAIEATAAREERDARSGLLPPVGEAGPSYDERMGLFKRSLLDTALAQAKGCRRKAADLLGLLPSTLCEKLKRLGGPRRLAH